MHVESHATSSRIDAHVRDVDSSHRTPPSTYANYLDLEKLLTLQNPRSTSLEHDAGVDVATGALPTR